MIQRLAFVSLILCLCVVVLGAYVRLSDAGLGCPDWPGCYGQIGAPEAQADIAEANAAFPERPVEVGKAWKEMIHRYVAGVLGLLILTMSILAWRSKEPRGLLPHGLLALVIFQAALGMWTVTLLLKPIVVTAHLLGGMTTLALLMLLWLRERGALASLAVPNPRRFRQFALVGLCVLAAQIFLGGWTSTNYAAMACPDFPTCQGQWIPPADYGEGFTLWRGLGVNYEYGVLDSAGRTAIQFVHRLGAIATTGVLGALGLWMLLAQCAKAVRLLGAALLSALALQVSIGISTVLLHLPLGVATAHNAGAALLLLVLVCINRAAFTAKAARPIATAHA